MGVGQVRDFYKLKELSLHDIEAIRNLAIEPSKPHLQELNKGWLEPFNAVFKIKSMIDKMGIDHPEINTALDDAIHNLEEELHSGIESSAIKYIDSILNENIDFYSTEKGCMDFAYYLCVQYVRTQKIQDNIFKNFRNIKSVNIENVWNVMRHIYATNMAWVLFAERNRFRMILIHNQSEAPLITGDQPVVNTYAVGKLVNETVDEVEFYYPVSPKLAILISEKEEYQSVSELVFNSEEAHLYNSYILKSFHEQIYSNSRETLESIICKK